MQFLRWLITAWQWVAVRMKAHRKHDPSATQTGQGGRFPSSFAKELDLRHFYRHRALDTKWAHFRFGAFLLSHAHVIPKNSNNPDLPGLRGSRDERVGEGQKRAEIGAEGKDRILGWD